MSDYEIKTCILDKKEKHQAPSSWWTIGYSSLGWNKLYPHSITSQYQAGVTEEEVPIIKELEVGDLIKIISIEGKLWGLSRIDPEEADTSIYWYQEVELPFELYQSLLLIANKEMISVNELIIDVMSRFVEREEEE
jgi:hypothetical protein